MKYLLPTRYLLAFVSLFSFFFITSCASYSPSSELIGMPSDSVIKILGEPALRLSDDGGSIFVFTRGPFGKHTYFLYFSFEDKLLRSEQVLTESKFSLIKPGMTNQEVLMLIGPSKILMGGGKSSWTVWNYRYENSLCRWFQVEFRSDNVVKSAEYGRPPECNVRAPRVSLGR